tara:strand:+ start:2223 stop:3242 length:1020 start_codon:yes stop_codon:yes gene_type:complete
MVIYNSILVTGAAGFIGSALVKKLLINGHKVVGIDNMNSYYAVSLKKDRLLDIESTASFNKGVFKFFEVDIEDKYALKNLFENNNISVVVHLAAQAGVRFSIKNPEVYFQSNLVGFGNILELVRRNKISNFIFASSSSVYGGNKQFPYKEDQNVDHPVSLYAATKKSNELMAHSYSHLYSIPTTGLRFFTVYGPWGRPDMAPMIFTKSILEKNKISIFNYGDMKRDFTYIDDVIEGILKCCYKPATRNNNSDDFSSSAPYRVFNIGNGNPIKLMSFIELLEEELDLKAEKEFLDMQNGDVKETWANTDELRKWISYAPSTSMEIGVKKFVEWYKKYYSI